MPLASSSPNFAKERSRCFDPPLGVGDCIVKDTSAAKSLTKLISARGRPNADKRCDACWRTESIGHILQVCPRTWGHRIMRHDTLMEKFLQQLEIRGWTVCRALTIPVRGGTLQKPDGVIYKDTQCWVIDATIVADNAKLNDAFMSKCYKYDTQAVRDWCRSNRPSHDVSDDVLFGALVFHWQGAMAAQSASMCRSLNISKSFMKLLSVCVVQWG